MHSAVPSSAAGDVSSGGAAAAAIAAAARRALRGNIFGRCLQAGHSHRLPCLRRRRQHCRRTGTAGSVDRQPLPIAQPCERVHQRCCTLREGGVYPCVGQPGESGGGEARSSVRRVGASLGGGGGGGGGMT